MPAKQNTTLDPKTKAAVQKLIDTGTLTEDDVQSIVDAARADFQNVLNETSRANAANIEAIRADLSSLTAAVDNRFKSLEVVYKSTPVSGPVDPEATPADVANHPAIVDGPTVQLTSTDGKSTIATTLAHADSGRPVIVTHVLDDIAKLAQTFKVKLGPAIAVDARHVAFEVLSRVA